MTINRSRASGRRRETITSTDDEDVELSVVVITENEEDRIGECIESIFAASRRAVDSFEVVLVDSDSTDRTREIASEYPISVYKIPEEHVVSCGAGRYVGDTVARGEMVLHVDGDMSLTPTWLSNAVSYLRNNENVAAVEGCLNEVNQSGVVEEDTVGGVMLFDAKTLESVGGFDPYLLGYEDIDVSYRLVEKGYRLVRLPEVSAYHPSEGALSMPIRRWRAGYYTAPGQAIRKSMESPRRFVKMIALQRYKLLLLGWLVVGVFSLLTTPFLVGWIGLSVVGFAVVARRRGLLGAVEFFLTKSMGIVGLARGIHEQIPSRDTYPLDTVEDVKRGPVHYTESTQSENSERTVGRQF